jgi:hypothetical protein
LGTNASIPLLRELKSLPSHGKFNFLQSVQPTNLTNVLCEGYSFEETPEGLETRATETRIRNNERKRTHMETVGRFNYVCANCESEDSGEWYSMQGVEEQGDRICRRCHAHYNSYGAYPDDDDLQRLADKSARIAGYADNPPPPVHCENPECGHDGDSKWHWSSKHKFYIYDACKVFARDNDDELRIPQRHENKGKARA